MGNLSSVLSASTPASPDTSTTDVPKRSDVKGRSFPEASVSSSSRRASRKRKISPDHNTKLKYKKPRFSTNRETLLLEEACSLDEIQIIRQQILKDGIQLDDMVLPDGYRYPEGQQQPRQSSLMSLRDEDDLPLFAGSVIIQTHIQALAYALSEYKLRGRIRNRTVYWVDGSVAQHLDRKNAAGVAVVSKSTDEGSPFSWKILGYKVHGDVGCPDIELLAILRALQIAYDKAVERISNGAHGEQEILVIYSDCKEALRMILHLTRAKQNGTNILVEEVIELANVLTSLFVSVELHWVPAHRDVPGNYLADYAARRAWDKTFRFELTTSEEALCRDYKMRSK
ncbi:hypothetical protein DTO271D3_1421 [Paecilomyces variotii]|nr:hypothetical protein DTO169C6_52 [Paecilomyces variotii]KAJ9297423.1 hypothetical protein DTO217A2_8630 [Paecilomyces variotii]KAJ9318164.1 hypothetical protein DTO271D3_1421 [Paecilomyces variotii]